MISIITYWMISSYLQNPSVRNIITDEGFVKAVNQQPILKHHIIYLDADAPDIPSKYPATLKEVNELDDPLIEAIQRLRVILDERPVATRRVIGNKFPLNLTGRLRLAYPYVGYTFRKGPWRDTLIRYGVDPRTNPDHRFYQTLFFRIGNLEQKKDEVSDFTLLLPGTVRTEPTGQCSPEAENSHVYDGRVLHRDGKVWQVCDIVDPVLKEILETDKLRSECDVSWRAAGL